MDILPLLRCFKRVLAECPKEAQDLLLLLAGEDARYNYAKEVEEFAKDMQIADKVLFRKNPSFIEQPLIYSASDIFISPVDNFQESFGITILEAMSSGLPVIASDWNGYKDTVLHGKTGYRVPTYWMDCEDRISLYSPICDFRMEHLFLAQSVCVDMNKMVEYLSMLVKHPRLRHELGVNARNVVLEKFDWKSIIKQYEELWKELYELSQFHDKPPADKSQLLRPNRFTTFKSYPSEIIAEDTKVRITCYGDEILKKKQALKPYKGMKSMLLFPIIQDALSLATGEPRVGEVVEKLLQKYQKYSPSPQDVKYQIMWMLKHDLLEVLRED